MKEEWKDIKGFEGKYKVSNLGRIKSFTKREPFILKQYVTRFGYFKVILGRGSHKVIKPKTLMVHRIVATAFIPNPHNFPQVNHKDENKKNNRVDNLEWCTAKYNMNYGTVQQRCHPLNLPGASTPVVQYDLEGNKLGVFPSAAEAQRQTGVRADSIYACIYHKCGCHKTYGKYVWKHIDEPFTPIPEPRTVATPVLQFTLDGTFVKRWKSQVEVANFYKVSQARGLSDHLAGKMPSYRGFIWKKE